jgi:two-component sensor histidine kinase
MAASMSSGRIPKTVDFCFDGRKPWAARLTTHARQGFGTRVMENMIKQLKGEMRFEWKPQGLVCEIVIPAA